MWCDFEVPAEGMFLTFVQYHPTVSPISSLCAKLSQLAAGCSGIKLLSQRVIRKQMITALKMVEKVIPMITCAKGGNISQYIHNFSFSWSFPVVSI